nr:C2 calcium lipid binding region CaLB [Hymenolepis microstoma]
MDGSSMVTNFINQPIGKLLFSDAVTYSKGSKLSKSNPHELINLWINQNRRFCVDLLNLCVPNGITRINFLPHVSSPLMYSQMKSPTVSANVMTIPVLIMANRLSFSCQRQVNQRPSHIKFSISNFSLEVILNLSFNQTRLITLRGISSHPQFSLSIESADPLENMKQDLVSTIEGIVENLQFIWQNADALLQNQDLYKEPPECIEPLSNLESKAINENTVKSQNGLETEDDEKSSDLDVKSLDSFLDACSVMGFQLNNGDINNAATKLTASESLSDSTEVLQEPVVLAHNPSLKKKMNESIRRERWHQRSASDFNLNNDTLPTELNFDDGEPVPLDPVVHPPEAQKVTSEGYQQSENRPTSHQRTLKKVTDVSPLHERVVPNLASKNLLVKVVKADFIDLKSSSDAYCVVELDEPYQRHATHVVPPSEQLFWDQHLLFGLNSNSKRAAFEIFELNKRRKSISRGYAEVYLPDLLTSMAGGCSSELLRCITLDPKQHSSSTSGMMGGPSGAGLNSAGGGAWDFASSPASSPISLAIRKPTVTAEFHFMERILDDPFSICKGRSGVGSPIANLKIRTAALTSPASSSDSSISQTAITTVSIPESGNALVTTNASDDRSPHDSKALARQSIYEELVITIIIQLSLFQFSEKLTGGNGQMETENSKDPTPTPKTDGNQQHESRLQRSTSTRGSRLFEPAYENLRMADTNAAALSVRQHSSKAFRRKSSVPRVISNLTSGGCGSANTSSGFGLLGPSSQLAGVVAGLTAASVESSEASVDPSTAAAVASALAVAAATGRSTSASAPMDRRSLVGGGSGTSGGGLGDSLFEGSTANLGHGDHGEPLGETVVRYAAPAANVAESLGTFSAQPPLKRPDATGTKLMNLFKSKKKHQPSGMARLLYLQNLEGSEFDAISTEGYQRIVHGDQLENQ